MNLSLKYDGALNSVDKTSLSVAPLWDQGDELKYWLSKSPTQRWQAIRPMPQRWSQYCAISGVDFADCYRRRVMDTLDGVEVNLIGLEELKVN